MTPHGFFWHYFFYYLWIAPHVLQLVVLLALLRRGLHRQFPVFLAYTAYEICLFAVLFVMHFWSRVTVDEYVKAHLIGSAGSTALRFGLVYEVFAHMFRNYAAVSRFGRPLFRWVAVALLVVGLILAVYAGGADSNEMLLTLRILDRTTSILQCGLLVGLFMFSSYLGLSWRGRVFGIALGLGVFSSMELAAFAIWSQVGSASSPYLNYFNMATYHVCVLIWIFYLWAPERSLQYSVKKLPENDLELWNQELQRLINQ